MKYDKIKNVALANAYSLNLTNSYQEDFFLRKVDFILEAKFDKEALDAVEKELSNMSRTQYNNICVGEIDENYPPSEELSNVFIAIFKI
jgi:hypothetical protein